MGVVGVLLFLAVCAYIGAGFYEDLASDVQTVQAESIAIIESTKIYGIAVRQEQLLVGLSAENSPENGERYPAGSALSGVPATFYEYCDGFEHLSPDMLFPFSADTFSSLMAGKSEKLRHSAGRLVFDNVWYFAAEVREGSAPSVGQGCRLLFQDIETECQALVWADCRDEDREYVLLRINGGGEKLLSLRKCSAELILDEHRGLKIPVDAVHTDSEGKKYIWVLTAGLVEARTVDIIYTGDDFCLAQQSYSWDALREGESIVINREIWDEGKAPG